jgi:hypothetical protein
VVLFRHQHFQAPPRQKGRRRKAADAGAHHDDIVLNFTGRPRRAEDRVRPPVRLAGSYLLRQNALGVPVGEKKGKSDAGVDIPACGT